VTCLLDRRGRRRPPPTRCRESVRSSTISSPRRFSSGTSYCCGLMPASRAREGSNPPTARCATREGNVMRIVRPLCREYVLRSASIPHGTYRASAWPARRGMRSHISVCRSLIDRSERLVNASGVNLPPHQPACRASFARCLKTVSSDALRVGMFIARAPISCGGETLDAAIGDRYIRNTGREGRLGRP
jgi:hypothetical protein